jgi:hypothetical protein
LTDHRAPKNLRADAVVSECGVVDHLAWAQGYRDRAAQCRLSAKAISSTKFGDCYRLLAQHYVLLANLEEDFVRRQTVSLTEAEMNAAD